MVLFFYLWRPWCFKRFVNFFDGVPQLCIFLMEYPTLVLVLERELVPQEIVTEKFSSHAYISASLSRSPPHTSLLLVLPLNALGVLEADQVLLL
jgi:hypothetical protein